MALILGSTPTLLQTLVAKQFSVQISCGPIGTPFCNTSDCFKMDGTNSAHYTELFEKFPLVSKLLVLVSSSATVIEDPLTDAYNLSHALFCLLQHLSALSSPPQLWVILPAYTSIASAPLWGMMRAVTLEQPALSCKIIGYEAALPVEQLLDLLVDEMATGSPEQVLSFPLSLLRPPPPAPEKGEEGDMSRSRAYRDHCVQFFVNS